LVESEFSDDPQIRLFRVHDVHFSLAEPARDFQAQILVGKSKSLFAVWTLSITVRFRDLGRSRIETKIGRAEFTLDPLTQVFPIDLQFLMAARAFHEQPGGGYFDHTLHLLKRHK
jgi:hypothetical protein